MSIFEKAARRKLRFETPQGHVSAEDLWDLPLTSRSGRANLDDVARGLHKQLRSGDDVSFVNKEQKSDDTVQLGFDIVKHVIDVRLAEAEETNQKQAKAAKKQFLLSILADKQSDAFKNMSEEDLQKAIAEL